MACGTSSIPGHGGSPVEPILVVRGLKTEFTTSRGILRAVDGVDLDIGKGEVLGLVGESGCGKTVTALSIMYLLAQPPGRIAGGAIWFRGLNLLAGSEEDIRVRPRSKGPPRLIPSDSHLKRHRARMNKIRGRGLSMVFQEPMSSLNPVLRVGYQVAEVIMFQRRQELCDRILSHRSLTPEDRDLFHQAIVTLDPAERDRIVVDLSGRAGFRADKVNALIDASRLSIDERIQRLERLAGRPRKADRWWARFLKRLDALEEAHVAREWARLSRQSLGQAAIDLFDPNKNPIAKGLPPLASVSPREEALELYFRASPGRGRDREKGGGLVPTEDLRAAVEDLLQKSEGGPFGVMFADVESVV